MPHVPIIVDTEAVLNQIEGYHETISDNIENNVYEGAQLDEARGLLTSTESLLTDHLSALNSKVGELETFLGI